MTLRSNDVGLRPGLDVSNQMDGEIEIDLYKELIRFSGNGDGTKQPYGEIDPAEDTADESAELNTGNLNKLILESALSNNSATGSAGSRQNSLPNNEAAPRSALPLQSAESAFCPSCGSVSDGNDLFCMACGSFLA